MVFIETATAAMVRLVGLPGVPSGLTLSADGTKLFVTCASAASRICEFDTALEASWGRPRPDIPA